MQHYDITIAGAGPAGSAAALYLSRAGFSVLLLEKKMFPRETVCGEFYSPESLDVLDELELKNNYFALDPNPIDTFAVSAVKSLPYRIPLGFTAYGLKRGEFDDMLMQSARRSGSTILMPAELKSVTHNNGKYVVSVQDAQSGQKFSCSEIILAYGKYSSLDSSFSRKPDGVKSGFIGIKYHVPVACTECLYDEGAAYGAVRKNEIHILLSRGIYCGINYVSKRIINVCMLIDQRLTRQVQAGDVLHELYESFPVFRHTFSDAAAVAGLHRYGTGNIYFGRRELISSGMFVAGDAARVIAPLAGDGISMALSSGLLAAMVIEEKLTGRYGKSCEWYENRYGELWMKRYSKRLLYAGAVQRMIFSRLISGLIPDLLPYISRSIPFLIRHTR
ncbi:MAG: NAD(P)/FAD-dependent oxidoreductase [Bacteroidota bacterium]